MFLGALQRKLVLKDMYQFKYDKYEGMRSIILRLQVCLHYFCVAYYKKEDILLFSTNETDDESV